MGDLIEKIDYVTPKWYKILLASCVAIYVTAFFLPPMGAVDPSVVQGLMVLITGGLFGLIPYYLRFGKSVKVSKGDASIEVTGHSKEFADEEGIDIVE